MFNISDASMKKGPLIITFLLGALSLWLLNELRGLYCYWSLSPTEKVVVNESKPPSYYRLVDANEAPEEIRPTVLRGYDIFMDTPQHAPDYSGNGLSCTHCHFAGGNTTGGQNGSISLAGIAALYPSYNKRAHSVVTLGERINGCFIRSMNGRPLPLNSNEMDALLTYLHWIAKDYPTYSPIPWRGLRPLTSQHTGDADHGAALYAERCARCHGVDGEGGERIPPLWGNRSYNDGAGMHNPGTFAAFIHANMPYQEPELTEEEAIDIAAYVHSRPRPHFQRSS